MISPFLVQPSSHYPAQPLIEMSQWKGGKERQLLGGTPSYVSSSLVGWGQTLWFAPWQDGDISVASWADPLVWKRLGCCFASGKGGRARRHQFQKSGSFQPLSLSFLSHTRGASQHGREKTGKGREGEGKGGVAGYGVSWASCLRNYTTQQVKPKQVGGACISARPGGWHMDAPTPALLAAFRCCDDYDVGNFAGRSQYAGGIIL